MDPAVQREVDLALDALSSEREISGAKRQNISSNFGEGDGGGKTDPKEKLDATTKPLPSNMPNSSDAGTSKLPRVYGGARNKRVWKSSQNRTKVPHQDGNNVTRSSDTTSSSKNPDDLRVPQSHGRNGHESHGQKYKDRAGYAVNAYEKFLQRGERVAESAFKAISRQTMKGWSKLLRGSEA